jgi:hypothetical protein
MSVVMPWCMKQLMPGKFTEDSGYLAQQAQDPELFG